jgi:1-acyl-sn-glycerol-3-phosphate acyltransferase
LGSLCRVIYISKSQVKNWPLFGQVTIIGRTIFIDRARKNKVDDYIQETISVLKKKVNTLIFPEGTSTNGERLLCFQSVHFQSPLEANSPILPLSIAYTKIDGEEVTAKNRDNLCWYGQIKFQEHLLQVLKIGKIEATVTVYPKIYLGNFLKQEYNRKELSEKLHDIIAQSYPIFKQKR